MKRLTLFLICTILGLELKSQIDFGESDYFLPLKYSKNNSEEISILNQKSQKIIFEINESNINSADDIQLLMWNKFGDFQIFYSVFKNQNQFILPDSIIAKWRFKEFKFSFILNRQIIWEKSISNIETLDVSQDEKKNITKLQIRINDNLATNKELGKINNKIELGESFVFKYLLKTENDNNRYKIWFSVDQPGIICNLDTFVQNGNFIHDSVKFSCPFSYPKYGRTFTVTMHYLNSRNKFVDSFKLSLTYNDYLGLDLTSPFELNSEMNEMANSNKDLLFKNEYVDIFRLDDKIIVKKNNLNFS